MDKKAYKIYDIDEIVECATTSLHTFSRTINDIYLNRLLKSSNISETLVTLIETLIESECDELRDVILDCSNLVRDILLEIEVSTNWDVRYGQKKHFVGVKVQLSLKDNYVGEEYYHLDNWRVNVVAKD